MSDVTAITGKKKFHAEACEVVCSKTPQRRPTFTLLTKQPHGSPKGAHGGCKQTTHPLKTTFRVQPEKDDPSKESRGICASALL